MLILPCIVDLLERFVSTNYNYVVINDTVIPHK